MTITVTPERLDELGRFSIVTRNLDNSKPPLVVSINRTNAEPGMDLSGQPQNIQDFAAKNWTPDVVAKYQDKVAADMKISDDQIAAQQIEANKYLPPDRFWTIVALTFPNDGLRDAIKGAFGSDPVKLARALAKLDYPPGGMFYRNDPLFNDPTLLAALNIKSEQVDGLWQQGWQLPE